MTGEPEPQIGDVWRNRKNGREARVLYVCENHVIYMYRTGDPKSLASQMTRNRRMRTPVRPRRFREMFEFVRSPSDEEKGRMRR